MLEVLLWLVGRYSEQGVMLHVCSKAFQRRPFGMTWLEVGARRALGAIGGARCDSATMCYSGPGAGRSGGVLPGPVAPGPRSAVIPPLPRAGVREHHAPVGALRRIAASQWVAQVPVREHHAPVGALRPVPTGSFRYTRPSGSTTHL